ncbi:MAG: recombinase family protein [Clostridiales bacterium]|nr:recombinase family protein [Clostridiales bacterium]
MEDLTARGVLNCDGRPLTLSCLQHAMHNTKHIDKYMQNWQEVEGACEALISVEAFNAVQERLNAVKHAPAAQKERQGYLELIATSIVAKCDNEFNDKRIEDLERQCKKLDMEINAAADASLSTPAKVCPKHIEKIEVLETQKADIELNLATLKIANEHGFTQEQIAEWLKQFCRGEALDEEYQRRIIDLFINSVYLYDDNMVMYYNVNGGKQVSYVDMEGLEPLDGGEYSCGDEGGSDFAYSTP